MVQATNTIPIMRRLHGGGLTVAQLSAELSQSPEAVVKRLQTLRDFFGAAWDDDSGSWRLTFIPQWLDADKLAAALPGVSVVEETSGTNDLAKAAEHEALFFTEHQRRGRGRYGRRWLAMPAGSVLLSARLPAPPLLSGLSLAVGAALWRALGCQLQLKWPNDLLDKRGRKVGGILVETAGEAVVIGIGINLVMTQRLQARLGRAVAGLENAPPRNDCAILAGRALRWAVADFAGNGLAGFLSDMAEAHYVRPDESLSFTPSGGAAVDGRFAGFSDKGALLIRHGGGVHSYVAGEITRVAGG